MKCAVRQNFHSLPHPFVNLLKLGTLVFNFISNDSSAVASMRPTEALALVKFWRISPIIFILHKRSSDIFNACPMHFYALFLCIIFNACPRTPLATPACLGWPFGLATALDSHWEWRRTVCGDLSERGIFCNQIIAQKILWTKVQKLKIIIIGDYSVQYTLMTQSFLPPDSGPLRPQ